MAQEPLEFVWDATVARYRDPSGAFVSREFVQRALEVRFNEAAEVMRSYTAALEGGASAAQWQQGMMVELRRAHLQAAALGKGGWEQMTPSDWGRVGASLRKEYGYLRDFAQEIGEGGKSLAQINAQVEMYAEHLQQSYWGGATAAEREAGRTEERRVLTPAEHCDDCQRYADMSWQPINSLPEPGVDSVCAARCHCVKEYR